MPRGGKRPGAGAPKGNTNALRYGRYSRQFPHAAMLVAILLELRRELDLALAQSPTIANRRLRELIAAADQFIEVTPDLTERIEVAIFVRRNRLVLIDRAQMMFEIVILKPRPDRLRTAIGFAGWLMKRDSVFDRLFTAMLLPPIRAALASQQQGKKSGRNSIKQSNSRQNESPEALVID